MNNRQFAAIRNHLGKSQAELSELLCVSPKTIQSLEQGWRGISSHIERQMLFLVFLKRPVDKSMLPCWEIKNCLNEYRRKCVAWEFQAGHLCWYITGTFCQGKCQKNWDQKIDICKDCEVFQTLIPWVSALS